MGISCSSRAIRKRLVEKVEGISIATEEILASLVGAMLCSADTDRDSLMAKATVELITHGAGSRDGDPATARIVEPAGDTIMIGPKNLRTIRQDLRLCALAATGQDAIR